jgi:hypothetical protein
MMPSNGLTVLLSILLFTFLPLPLAHAQSATSDATPDAAAQDQILDAMHRYAAQYVSNLPNFLCLQVTRQFDASKKSNRWHQGTRSSRSSASIRARKSVRWIR